MTVAMTWLAAAIVLLCPSLTTALGPAVAQATLPNGATLLVSEQRNLPMVLVWIVLDAGARRDPLGRAGLANLTADLLTEGTTTRSASEISDAIDFVGGSLGAGTGMDYAFISLQVLRKDLQVGLDLMADILLRPTFAADELARQREAVLASIHARQDNPTAVAALVFRETLFAGQPYGHPIEGTEGTVPSITRADIQGFYTSYYRPGRAAIVVAGDIDMTEAHQRFAEALAGWQDKPESAFTYPSSPPPAARTVGIDRPVTQASVILGNRGVARDNSDFEAIRVMNYVLGGGGLTSRLTESIRAEAGLAYSVSSYFTVNKDPGSFQIVMQTKNRSVADAIDRARAQVERIRSEPISDEELEEAKSYLTGSFPLRLDNAAKIVGFISQVWFYGLGTDYADAYVRGIAAVTKEDVLRVARVYLHPDRFIEVVVGNLAEASRGASAQSESVGRETPSATAQP